MILQLVASAILAATIGLIVGACLMLAPRWVRMPVAGGAAGWFVATLLVGAAPVVVAVAIVVGALPAMLPKEAFLPRLDRFGHGIGSAHGGYGWWGGWYGSGGS